MKMTISVSWHTSRLRSPSGTHSRMRHDSRWWEGPARKRVQFHSTHSSSPSSVLICTSSPRLWSKVRVHCLHQTPHLCDSSPAILFWLNCKSVYSYWQNQRKLLNEEVRVSPAANTSAHPLHTVQVQIATEKFVAQIQSRRPATLQGSSLDFSKPRLVQISMTDVGACMPMAPVVSQTWNWSDYCYPGCLGAALHSTDFTVISSSCADSEGNAAGC